MDTLNITFNVDNSVLEDWKEFMSKVFIPFSNVKDKFVGHNYYHVMVEDPSTETYCYQVLAEEEATIDTYLANTFPALQRELTQAFGEKVLLFNTKLKEVEM